MNWMHAIVLGIIEGFTEFLPISSTGHMVLAAQWMQVPADEFSKAFEVIIQLGPILMVVWAYRERFKLNVDFYRNLFIAFLPAAIVGFALKNQIDVWLESPLVVITTLILGGFVLLWADRWDANRSRLKIADMNAKNSLQVGAFQCFALIPGVSRSGATIIGGLLSGLSRAEAAEFSFFLAVPTMAAATGYKLAKLVMHGPAIAREQWGILALGFIVASVVAALVIRGFVAYLQKRGFAIFGWYRIILGGFLLALHFLSAS